ncbi:urea carboxylase [Dorcoceras hygrometricum]|uniref:Urea carboxylase n=1 Tax=Dorcoceras hygrometricum TaxID=472368 RepID=A0A2Z7D1S2_9LAMI|nr:urea carboxylase [Dorcoceras hygrometricum]
MTFRVVRTNQYNQDLGLIHSTNGNHLENPNEGSSIDHQVTIYLHDQNITMFPTNETCWWICVRVSAGCSAGVDVNAGQLSCSSKRKHRRFVVATGSPAASESLRFCLLYPAAGVISCATSFEFLPESSGFLAGLVLAQYKLLRGSSFPLLFGVSCIAPAFYSLLFISVVLLLSVLGFDPMSLRGLVCFFVALFSGNPGSTAGRGFNPAGGAPGGG